MGFQLTGLIASTLLLLSPCTAFSVTASNDANTLANAIFSGPGITILQAAFSGAAQSSGTFTDGPFGIGNAGMLTSGAAVGALPGGNHYVNNGAPGSDTYCGPNTFNAAILTVDFFINPTYNGIDVEFIMASEEEGGSADPIGFLLGGTQYALDDNGNRFTATSAYLAQPIAITPPDSVTSYPGSSPPLIKSILASGGQTLVISICDQSDAEWDSALLVKIGGCVDCNTVLRLDYVTTTVTVDDPTSTYTSTKKASGTVSGTITIGAFIEATTTTTTTTSEESTTTTTTTSEETTTTTTTTSEETTTTTTTSEESTTTTTTSEETTTMTTTSSEESTTTSSQESTTTTTTTSEESTTTTTTSEESTTTTTTSEESTTSTTTSEESTTTSDVSSSTDSSTSSETTSSTSSSSESGTTTSSSTETTPQESSTESTTTSESTTGSLTESSSSASTTESTTTGPTSNESIEPTFIDSTTRTSESVSTLVSTTDSTPNTSFGPSTDTRTTRSPSVSTDSSTRSTSTTISLSTANNSTFISSAPSSTPTSTPASSSTGLLTSTPSSVPTGISTGSPTFSSSVEPSESETVVPDTSTTASSASESSTSVPNSESLSTSSFTDEEASPIPTDLPTSVSSGSSTLPESSSTSTEATASASASNLPRIGQYEFVGCLGSSEGYPTFDLVGSGPDLTTVDCISLGEGRAYIGIFNRSCYAADSLSFTALVGTGSCDIPCPGDPGLFCGGFVDPTRTLAKRSELGQSFGGRAAPAGILLTLYSLADALPVSSSDSSAIGTETRDQTSATALESESVSNTISSLPASIPTSAISSADISFIPSASQSLSNSDLPVLPSASDSDDNSPSESFPTLSITDLPVVNPNNPIPLPSAPFQIGNFSAAATNLETLVTTVVYTIIDPQNPSYLTVTEICTTMKYAPCRQCQQPRLPTVEMTTIKTTCDACGYHGENTVTLTIPMCALTASTTAEPIVLEPATRVEAHPAASAGWESPPLHVRPSKAVVHAGPPDLPAEHLPKETQRPHGDDQPVVYDSEEPASQGQDQPVVYDHDGPASYEHDQPQPNKPHDVEINGGETPKTSSEDDQTPDREQDKPIPTVEKPQEPHVEAQSPDHEDDHTPPARETVQEPHQDNHSPAPELPTPVASHQKEQPTIVASHNDYSNQDEPAVPNLPPNPVAQPTNAVPVPKPAGPPEEPKVIPAVSTAIVPDMPPDSPIVVVASSIQKQIDGVLMLFVFIAGLFFVL
ncbi:hypothetical protein FALBO_341 [Fusarium albosuccineum]|uniref:WSC domain-containing protein n=1 Tax=Fusarium albosuccineum TaxID=1237068 RepID=A0A8H4LPV7_9HYPO|nr:hypothetical protein FALBO_341 [Fusarium albosuccineum]